MVGGLGLPGQHGGSLERNIFRIHYPVQSCFSLLYALVYPMLQFILCFSLPSNFYTLEWMEIQTGLPLSGLLKLCCRTTYLSKRLQT